MKQSTLILLIGGAAALFFLSRRSTAVAPTTVARPANTFWSNLATGIGANIGNIARGLADLGNSMFAPNLNASTANYIGTGQFAPRDLADIMSQTNNQDLTGYRMVGGHEVGQSGLIIGGI